MNNNIQSILTDIKRHLIRAFAQLDGWFDKEEEALYSVPLQGSRRMADILGNTMHINRLLLEEVHTRSIRAVDLAANSDFPLALAAYEFNKSSLDETAVANLIEEIRAEARQLQSLQHVRRELRDQLNECLYHLELLGNGEGALYRAVMAFNSLLELDAYQCLYFVALNADHSASRLRQAWEGVSH